MNIQWYPGHMAKTKRKLEEQLHWVDAVIELGDARLPVSSRNPLLKKLLGSKPSLLLLNKNDLADKSRTGKWLEKLAQEGPVLTVSVSTGAGLARLFPLLEELMAAKKEYLAAKGIQSRPTRAMVVGIPNSGKSSLINRLSGRASTKTGNKPGVTRGNQWIRIHNTLDLLDTPGMLWPKFDDPLVGRKLAVTGAIRDEVYDQEELASWLLDWLKENYSLELTGHYKIPLNDLDLNSIGRTRGCLLSGGRIDTLKASQGFLKEFRTGKIAQVTMD